ncbi:MAG TPA: hydroxymethylbilane synthase [Cyclobacteriaceae bacterium]|nr:hydroxymethylbilane synthase [Cyclobacteriaceae bacterium]
MNKTIRIGTKGNKLGLWQAEYVANLIKPSAYTTEIISVEDEHKGDPKKNLEMKLLKGDIDIVVHHGKDVPSELHEELELVAFTERESPNDAVISHHRDLDLNSDAIKIGTSSIRRIAFIKHFYPFSKPVFAHGDIPNQIKQMKAGEYDALLLAYADVHHLGHDDLLVEKIETSYFVPAVGQGTIVVECHKKLSFDKKEVIQRWVNHEETEDCIRTERSFSKTLNHGYNIPVFGYAQYEGNLITLKAGVISLDGKQVVKTKRSSTVAESKELGKKVAFEVLQNGGERILQEIHS